MSGTRRSTVPLLAGVLVVLVAGPALAHPFGPPPVALVTAEGRRVVVHWQAAPDDAVAVGAEIGVVPDDLVDAYIADPGRGEVDERALSRSAALQEYLLERIAVHQDGVRCRPTLEPLTNFVRDGAVTVHHCPEPVDAVDLTITVLHDRDPAYRTFAISGDGEANPQHAAFSADAPQHRWDFTSERASAPGIVSYWPLAGAALALLGVVVVVLRGGRSAP